MREIDIENWDRKANYEWFSTFPNPCFGMDVRMDITKLRAYCRENGISSFAAIMYIMYESMMEVESFRYRIKDGKVVVVDDLRMGYTLAVGEHFVNSYIQPGDFASFVKQMDENKRNASLQEFKEYNEYDSLNDVYNTTMPWLDFVSAVHPIPLDTASNCIPRTAWGKYVQEGDSWKMTLNITANHALVDGRDMAMLFNKIQERFDDPKLV